jgi:hypothetical protein
MDQPLSLSQNIYVLGIHPKKGGIIPASYTAMDYVLIGSLFLELYLNKNILFEDKRIKILNPKSGNSLHRFLLEKMNRSKRPLKISRWINKLYFSMSFIKKEVQNQLVDKRVIRMEPKRFLIFKWHKPVLVKTQVVYSLIKEIESYIFGGPSAAEEIMLLSLLKPAGLLKRVFPEKERLKRAKRNLKRLMVENQVSSAVADAISASNAVAASLAATSAAASAAT